MKYLFTSSGLRILESLTFTDTLFAFDFDGTLAPIVKTPDLAKAPPSTNALIRSLCSHVPVAVLSGRSISDLKKRLHFSPHHLIGNHGLEGLSLRKESANQAQKVCLDWKNQLKKKWKFESGVFIEDKTYTLALHYRNSRNKKAVKAALFERIGNLDPAPRVVLGKCVMNLVPAGAPHKGIALLESMMSQELKCAFYVGDDDTDEDVFSLPDSRIITVRIGPKKNSHAQFYLKRQNEINKVLQHLVDFMAKRRRK